MVYGFFVSLDCFLYVFTFLPIRIVVAMYHGLASVLLLKRLVRLHVLFYR